MKILYQFDGKPTYGGNRIYIDREMLTRAGFHPGRHFRTEANPSANKVEFVLDDAGHNKVSQKVRKQTTIPVIDKQGSEIRNALENCDRIKITFVQNRVIIEGQKNTARVKKESNDFRPLRSITFCAGTGISAESSKQAGFQEVAAVEWNPKEGAPDKYANIFQENHSETVMFNLPMQELSADDLPYADLWVATLDCTDFSRASNGTKKKTEENFATMHLFMHLMRLFWQKPIAERPSAILIENVPEFQTVAGNSMELCLKEEGYHVTKGKLNSLDYGSRTKRERFFFVATAYEGFELPLPTGRLTTPIADDGVLTVDTLDWVTPEEHGTLRYFLEREKGHMTHNHRLTTFDVTKDSHVGTITKNHAKIQPENWIIHPTEPDTYAYLKAEDVKYLHGIPGSYYLGDSNKQIVEAVGQAVCFHTFSALIKALFNFLDEKRPRFYQAQLDLGLVG